MKNKIFYTLLILTTTISINAQEHTTYDRFCAQYNAYLTTPSDAHVYEMLIPDIEKKLFEARFELLVNKDESTFELVVTENQSPKDKEDLEFIALTYGYRTYYNLKTNYALYENPLEWLEFVKLYNWELLSESKVINGFTCYKAVCRVKEKVTENHYIDGITITAWYTPDIKSSFGPLATGGLPGLIVRLEDAVTTFELVDIQDCDKMIQLDFTKPIFTFH